jgi:tRNA A37 threonylcarbamoyladenosine dehydratase
LGLFWFQCVFSDELIQAKGEGKGSLVHITAIFGFMLAGLVIQDASTHPLSLGHKGV